MEEFDRSRFPVGFGVLDEQFQVRGALYGFGHAAKRSSFGAFDINFADVDGRQIKRVDRFSRNPDGRAAAVQTVPSPIGFVLIKSQQLRRLNGR
jgi:hypothetical protein